MNQYFIDDIDFSKLYMDPSEVEYVIYHGNCSDGFGSALCVYKYFNDNNKINQNINQPIFYAAKFGVLPPLDEIKNKCVLICDFSYKKDVLQKLLLIAKKLIILDHHKTAQDDLKDLPDTNKIFRMDHSGAYLTWRFFFRDIPVPKGILYIEDNDIWKKVMPNTYEFTAFMFSLPFTFEAYEKLFDENYIDNEVIPQGIGMVKQNNGIVLKSIKHAAPKFIRIGNSYYFVAYLNAVELKSELGNRIFTEYININFSVVYSHNDYNNTTNFSLRSLDTATDVSEIAKIFNGGGHRNASGVTVNYITNTLPITVVDNFKSYFLLNNIYGKTIVVNDNIYSIIYLNSSHYKKQLAKYLLQTRYNTSTNENIQECVSIMKNRYDNYLKILSENKQINLTVSDLSYENKYDLSAIWNYDGLNNCTWLTVHYKDQMLKNQLLEQFKGHDNFEQQEDIIIFSQKSFNPKVTCNSHQIDSVIV